MPLNERKEKFCQNYILHQNASRAAKDAGYSEASAHNQGYRLLQDPRILERIEELKAGITTDIDVIDEIEKQYEVARNAGNGTTALKALELLSRVRGNNSDAEDMTPESMEKEIVFTMQTLGFEKIFSLVEEAFPEQFGDYTEDFDVLAESEEDLAFLPEELGGTTDTETGSDYDA
jgi:hypothetical protein